MHKIIVSYMCLFFSSLNAWGNVLDEKGNPLPQVIEIFNIFDKGITPNPSLDQLNKVAQKDFLRPKGSERLSEEALAHYKKLSNSILSNKKDALTKILGLFRELGDLETVYPKVIEPDFILFQGSTVQNMRERLLFLISLIEQGQLMLSPKVKLVIITGDRTLWASETEEVLLHPPLPTKIQEGWQPPAPLPQNELDLGEFIWKQTHLPPLLRQHHPIFIRAQKKPGEARAQTDDGIRAFLKSEKVPNGARFLVLSSNPFVYYQTAVTRNMFKKLGYADKAFHVEGAGPAADAQKYIENPKYGIETAVGTLLDNLARTLYTEVELTKN